MFFPSEAGFAKVHLKQMMSNCINPLLNQSWGLKICLKNLHFN